MPWKAFKHILETHGIVLGFETSQKLFRLIVVKGDAEMITYKEALAHLTPNLEQHDPIASCWVLRSNPHFGESYSRQKLSVTTSPSKLSIRSINASPA